MIKSRTNEVRNEESCVASNLGCNVSACLCESPPRRSNRRTMPLIGYLASGAWGTYSRVVYARNEGFWLRRGQEHRTSSGALLRTSLTDFLSLQLNWHDSRLTRSSSGALRCCRDSRHAYDRYNSDRHGNLRWRSCSGRHRGPALHNPGGNITGVISLAPELSGKQLELLKETLPKLSRVAVMWNPDDSAARVQWQELQTAAGAPRSPPFIFRGETSTELDKAFEDAGRGRVDALVVPRGGLSYLLRKQIVALAERHRLPGMYFASEFVDCRRPDELLGK